MENSLHCKRGFIRKLCNSYCKQMLTLRNSIFIQRLAIQVRCPNKDFHTQITSKWVSGHFKGPDSGFDYYGHSAQLHWVHIHTSTQPQCSWGREELHQYCDWPQAKMARRVSSDGAPGLLCWLMVEYILFCLPTFLAPSPSWPWHVPEPGVRRGIA